MKFLNQNGRQFTVHYVKAPTDGSHVYAWDCRPGVRHEFGGVCPPSAS